VKEKYGRCKKRVVIPKAYGEEVLLRRIGGGVGLKKKQRDLYDCCSWHQNIGRLRKMCPPRIDETLVTNKVKKNRLKIHAIKRGLPKGK